MASILRNLVFFCLIFAVLTPTVYAQEPPVIQLDPNISSQIVKPFLRQFIGDPKGNLTPEEAWNKMDEFFPPAEMNDRFMDVTFTQYIWLAFQLENKSNESIKRIFTLNQQIPEAELFCPGAKLTQPQKAGPNIPITERPFDSDKVSFQLQLVPQEKIQCLIRYQSFLAPLMLVELQDRTEFSFWSELDSHIIGLFYGAAFLLFLYNLQMFFSIKEKVFLLYSLMIFFMTFFLWLRDGQYNTWFIISNQIDYYPIGLTTMIFGIVWIFLLMKYSREFTGFLNQFPRLTKPYKVIEHLPLLFLILLPFQPILTGYIVNMILLLSMMFIIIVSFISGFKGNKMAWWFLATLGFQMIGLSIEVFRSEQIFESNLFYRYGLYIFLSLEFFMLSVVMNRRVHWLKQEKLEAQTSLVENTQKYADELEGLVDARTTELQTSNEKLLHLNEEKNEFLNIVAHDLKNPLARIYLLVDIIENKLHGSEQAIRDKLGIIRSSSKTMTSLIKNLLDVGLFETYSEKTELEKVNLSDISDILLKESRFSASERNISLKIDFGRNAHTVRANPEWTKQVVTNLISNALKYSPNQSEITVSCSEMNGKIQLAVQDQGSGVPKENREKLFTKFGRLGNLPKINESSTGLGLHIVRLMMERMNGKVWLDESVTNGARFVLEFDLFAQV